MSDFVMALLALIAIIMTMVAYRYNRIAAQYHSRLQALNFQEAELERLAAQGGERKI